MKIGIALSGGGARGVVHIGVLKALDAMGVKIDVLSGTSAGSVIAALYAAGYKPDQIFEIVSSLSIYRSVSPAWAWSGLLKMDGLSDILHNYFTANSFEALERPLVVTATDIRNGHIRYFTEGELIPKLIASCSIPAIFSPVPLDGGLYVDGGLMDNMPVKPIVDKCDFVIGVHSNHTGTKVDPGNIKAVIERSLLLAIQSNTHKSRELCDVCIEPPCMDKYSTFDIQKSEEIYAYGYQYTLENFKPEQFSQISTCNNG